MRKLWAAGIAVALAVLWLAPPGVSGAAASESDQARLERYAATTWASFVAMVDTPSGLPTDQLHADGSTDVQTSITNIGAYLWSAVAAERLGIIGHDELVTRLSGDARDAGTDGAPPARRPVLQLVRPPRRRQAHDLATDRRRRWTRSCPRSTTAGSRPG